MKPLKVVPPKERNPLVKPALFRKAGKHQKPHKALRKAVNQSRNEFDPDNC